MPCRRAVNDLQRPLQGSPPRSAASRPPTNVGDGPSARLRVGDFWLGTVRMTIHTHSAQPNRSIEQGGPARPSGGRLARCCRAPQIETGERSVVGSAKTEFPPREQAYRFKNGRVVDASQIISFSQRVVWKIQPGLTRSGPMTLPQPARPTTPAGREIPPMPLVNCASTVCWPCWRCASAECWPIPPARAVSTRLRKSCLGAWRM